MAIVLDTTSRLTKNSSDSIESNIGRTPLIRLRRVTRDLPGGVDVLVKAEHLNPGGSVKDRAALAMILDGERTGRLYPGKTILDATSGNTGIAYAMLGAERGYPVTLCLPTNASDERKRILRVYGAEIIETDPPARSTASPGRSARTSLRARPAYAESASAQGPSMTWPSTGRP